MESDGHSVPVQIEVRKMAGPARDVFGGRRPSLAAPKPIDTHAADYQRERRARLKGDAKRKTKAPGRPRPMSTLRGDSLTAKTQRTQRTDRSGNGDPLEARDERWPVCPLPADSDGDQGVLPDGVSPADPPGIAGLEAGDGEGGGPRTATASHRKDAKDAKNE